MKLSAFLRSALIIGSLPVTLTNGTTADATQVMSDLNWIVNQVNANAAPLSNTAVLNANNNFTTVQSGVMATSGANFPIASQVQNWSFNTLTSTLGTNTISARVAGLTLTGYAQGQVFTFVPAQANTGSATLNIDTLGSGVIHVRDQQLLGAELGSSAAMVRVVQTTPMAVFDLLNPRDNGFRNQFTSAPQVITSAGALTIAHGLGTMPTLCQVRLKAINSVLGYTAGDEVIVGTSDASPAASRGISLVPDATNLNVRFGSDAAVYSVIRKDTGANAVATNTDWNIIFRAWA